MFFVTVDFWRGLTVLSQTPDQSFNKTDISLLILKDGWMNGVLGHFYALSRLNWAGDNLG